MKLQNILFPTASTAEDGGMYFFTSSKTQDSGQIRLEAGESLSTDTYFNGLSADKWKKYTVVRDVTLTLHLQGKVHYELFSKVDKAGRDEKLAEGILTPSTCWETLPIPWEEARGIVYFRLTALEPAVFYGGWYACATPAQRPVKIALDICTFRREAYVKENCRLLWERMTRDPDFGHFLIFVVDNGRTLAPGDLPEGVRLFPNANTGGSGGFTRGLMEIQQAARQEGITHALLMDDDVLLEPEALLRTYALLSLVKEEYQDGVVGGAMLRMDKKSVLVESGALWNRGWLISGKMGLDVSLPGACLESEREEPVDYTAWWYTCVPLSLAREDNLPLPFFVRGDDVEYGLRNARHILLLNGICIWHKGFANKYNAALELYLVHRNSLIIQAMSDIFPDIDIVSRMDGFFWKEIKRLSYQSCELLLDALEHYLNGPEFMMTPQGERIMKEQGAKNEKMTDTMNFGHLGLDLSKVYDGIYDPAELKGFKKFWYDVTRNGHLTPNFLLNRKVAAIAYDWFDAPAKYFMREGLLAVNPVDHTAYWRTRSRRRYLELVQRRRRLMKKYRKEGAAIAQQYREAAKTLKSQNFWEKYLQI